MEEQPARAVRRFEVLILRPLNIAFPFAVGVCLVKTAWTLAVVMVICWFAFGAIGQSLPHRKKQTFSELASGKTLPAQDGRPSPDDSYALARAAMQTAALLGAVAFSIAWKNGSRGWWAFLIVPGTTYIAVLILAALVGVGKPGKHRLME
jgi:hypothetical protein